MDAWLSQHPTREVDEPATKDLVELKAAELRAEIGELTGEMRVGFANVRHEMAELRTELRGEIRAEGDTIRKEMHESIQILRAEVRHLHYWMAGSVASFLAALVLMALQNR
jgi:hypothetical protein